MEEDISKELYSFGSRFDSEDFSCHLFNKTSTKIHIESEKEDCVIFQQLDLFSQGFPLMEEIRRQGKLCDVTLKVKYRII